MKKSQGKYRAVVVQAARLHRRVQASRLHYGTWPRSLPHGVAISWSQPARDAAMPMTPATPEPPAPPKPLTDPARATTDSFDVKGGEGFSEKLVDAIEMIGEEKAGSLRPAPSE